MIEPDLRQRPWRCRKCGQRVSSKSPGMRSVFPSMKDMIVTAMMANSMCHVVDDPARPAGTEMTPDYGRTKGVAEGNEPGKDLEIRVTIRNQRFPWSEDPDVQTPGQALHSFLERIRKMTPRQVLMYECAALDGHDFTDDFTGVEDDPHYEEEDWV